jgi:hypothetical protein
MSLTFEMSYLHKQRQIVRYSSPDSLMWGLLGLADRFKNLKGAPTDADIEELRKFFPERNEPE